jgi:Ser/Thr protein kinase RdoA (MazF antagonist)
MTVRYTPEDMQRRRAEALETFRAYCDARLLPALGLSGDVTLTPADLGRGSLIFFVEVEGAPSLVLRGDPKPRSLKRRIAGHRLLASKGIPVPKVVHRDTSRSTCREYGMAFATEERAPGGPLVLPGGDPAPIAKVFARLHGNTALTRGPLNSVRWPWPGPKGWLEKKSARWIDMYRLAGRPNLEAILSWIDAQPRAAWLHAPRLVMGDVTDSNVLVDDERVTLIDLSGVGYSSAPFEVVRLQHRFLHDDPQAWATFREVYLAEADPALRAEVEVSLPLMEAFRLMRQCARRTVADGLDEQQAKLAALIAGARG